MNQEQAKIVIKACPTVGAYTKLQGIFNFEPSVAYYPSIQDLARDGAVLVHGNKIHNPNFDTYADYYTAIPKRRINWRKVMSSSEGFGGVVSETGHQGLVAGIKFELGKPIYVKFLEGMWYPEKDITIKNLPDEYYEDIE